MVAWEDARARELSQNAGLQPILNDSPHLGLSRSVQLGLAALEHRTIEEVGAAIVFLGDQPLVRLAVVKAVITAWQEGRGAIVRPRYQGSAHVPGHPTLLDRSVWPLASELEGDHGFANLLASDSLDTFLLDVPGDNPDVDTRADLHALEEFSP